MNLLEIESKTIYHKFDKIHSGNNSSKLYIYIYICIYVVKIILYDIILLELDVHFNPNSFPYSFIIF